MWNRFTQIPIELYLAARYVTANIKQSLIIILAVGMGVAIITFIPSINLSFFEYFLEKTVQNAAHINITREIETESRNINLLKKYRNKTGNNHEQIVLTDQSLIRRRNITAYRRLVDEFKQIPGVAAAAPFIKDQGIVRRGGKSRSIDINGIIPEQERYITDIFENVYIGNLSTISNQEVFLGYLLADELGVQIGNRIQLVTPYGQKSYKVAGLIKNGNYLRDLSQVVMNLDAAQQLLNLDNEVTSIGIKLVDYYDAPKISNIIKNTYPVKVRNWMEDNVTILEQISNFRTIIAFISFMIVMAAASSITSVLIMVVASKSKEIGILKAMGTPGGSILRLFVIQAVFLSIFGALFGVFGGWFFIQVYNFSPMSTAETFLGIGREPATVNTEYAIYAVCYAIISSVLASLIPAWQASKLDPVHAINQ